MNLSKKTAVITGASRGIGAAIAIKLASLGANVAIIYAGNRNAAERICTQCEALGVKAMAYCCNVSDFTAVKETVAQIRLDFGGFDILVNNAGITRDTLVATMPEEDFDEVIDVNLKGTFHWIRHSIPIFLRKKGGCIINISSVSGLMGNPGQANYAASKAGIVGLTKSVAKELASKGITCNAIAPGFIATDMTKRFTEDESIVTNAIPLGRMGNPEDIANTAAFLATASYITGEVIRVDGGLGM